MWSLMTTLSYMLTPKLVKVHVLGTNTSIFSGVKVYHNTKLGQIVLFMQRVVIGSTVFGFAPNKENEYKVPANW